MSVLLIFVVVFAMPGREELTVFTMPMTLEACEAHVEKMRARYAKGGRWAQSYRHFHIRCKSEEK